LLNPVLSVYGEARLTKAEASSPRARARGVAARCTGSEPADDGCADRMLSYSRGSH